ncbi:MAG: DUF4855 domain-containing protein [Clostridia bacterium]|nr:DUF4855 domain-containing protein [Clostridia bacterium]
MDMPQQESYYTPFETKQVPERYFAKNDPDYRQEKNLLAGKGQRISSRGTVDGPFRTPFYNTPDTENRLTDGITAEQPTYTDPAWFRFTQGMGRTILFDLGAVGAVEQFVIRFLKERETGVRLPRSVSFSLSENGTDFERVALLTGFRSDHDSDFVQLRVRLEPSVRARFVRVTFPVASHVYIDQIEAIGRKDPSGARAVTPEPEDPEHLPNRYCTAAELGGAKDVLLAYFCSENREPVDASVFKPFVGYLDENGKAKDTLFDGYLFLPFVAFLYDRSRKRPLDKAKWQYYMDQQFLEGKNLDALEEAAEAVAGELGKEDLKLKVFFSIFYPVPEQHAFGEVGGRMLDFRKAEDRIAAMKWFIDEQAARFREKNYRRLELSGFYWFTEEIDYEDEPLLRMIRSVTDHVRSMGLITTWIPYFGASGFDDWRNLGFDMACYQPNYAFRQDVPEQRLFDAARTAKELGMCIELEVGGTQPWNVRHTRNYYAAGAVTGFMKDAAHMYYQDGLPGCFHAAYLSKDPFLHSMYDDTYRFIKGTYPEDGFDLSEKTAQES